METYRPGRPVPVRALLLSLGSLAVPVAWALFFPQLAGEEAGMLVWLTALVPAFLFTYYRGWRGASLALAAGMAVLSTTQVLLLLTGGSTPNWGLLLVVVLVYMGISFGVGLLAELLHRERREAQQIALTDQLTGLANRRHANIFLEASFSAAERGADMTVALFDVDNFKLFNDRYGHSAGDEILKLLAEVLKENTRQMNVSARWGGEEFLSVLSGTDLEGARIFADRIRRQVKEIETPWGTVTLSAGVAQHVRGMESPELLLAAADQALYRAKEKGRDQVQVAEEVGTAPAGARDDSSGRDETSPPLQRSGLGTSPASAGPGAETILVVEDDEDTRLVVSKSLELHGYRVLDAESGEDALAMLDGDDHFIDLLVTDIVLPGMSGFTLVEQILSSQPRLPVLYMSGYSHDHVSWDGVPGSRTGFMQKPLTVEDLGLRVREMLDQPPPSSTAEPAHRSSGQDSSEQDGSR